MLYVICILQCQPASIRSSRSRDPVTTSLQLQLVRSSFRIRRSTRPNIISRCSSTASAPYGMDENDHRSLRTFTTQHCRSNPVSIYPSGDVRRSWCKIVIINYSNLTQALELGGVRSPVYFPESLCFLPAIMSTTFPYYRPTPISQETFAQTYGGFVSQC